VGNSEGKVSEGALHLGLFSLESRRSVQVKIIVWPSVGPKSTAGEILKKDS
jgi:hypothetical protein